VSFDLYVWSKPRELEVEQAEELVNGWWSFIHEGRKASRGRSQGSSSPPAG
jgi:hypothetical protein